MPSKSAEVLEITKKCSHCGAEKELTQFNKSSRNKLGLNHRCKKCMWEYQKKWKSRNPHQRIKIIESARKRYAAKPDISGNFSDDTPHTCIKCNLTKTIISFSRDKKGKYHGRSDICKICFAVFAKKWHESRPIELRRSKMRQYKYGITPEQFEKFWVVQGGSCAICRDHLDRTSKQTVVDHCHSTGLVRGILCKKCNTTLGWARDDVKWLESAIKYLLLNRMEGV